MDCDDNYRDIQHDFCHSQGTKVVLQEGDRMHPDPRPFSLYTVKTDVTEIDP